MACEEKLITWVKVCRAVEVMTDVTCLVERAAGQVETVVVKAGSVVVLVLGCCVIYEYRVEVDAGNESVLI